MNGLWRLVQAVALALAYFATGRAGLHFATVEGGLLTAFWPPFGIAVAGIVLFGWRMFPAIYIGDLAISVTTGIPVPTAAGLAAADTIGALFAAFILRPANRFHVALERLRDIAHLGLAAIAAPLVGASIGVTFLSTGGLLATGGAMTAWTAWYLSDALGALIVAPALLVWSRGIPRRLLAHKTEAAGLLLVTAAVTLAAFGGIPQVPAAHAVHYLVLPPIAWGAYRFGPRAATSLVLVAGLLAVWGTTQGGGPFQGDSLFIRLTGLQVFVATLGLIGLLIASAVAERKAGRATEARLERRFHAFADGLNPGVWCVDRELHITYVNPSGAKQLGYDVDALLGRMALDLVDPGSMEDAAAVFARRARGETESFVLNLRHREGRALPFLVTATPNFDEDGDYDGSTAMTVAAGDHAQAQPSGPADDPA